MEEKEKVERMADEEGGRERKKGNLRTNRDKRQNNVGCMTEGCRRHPHKSVPGPKTTLSGLLRVLLK